jgi:glycine/D-amino acid oxidase-like deaminating enzyme
VAKTVPGGTLDPSRLVVCLATAAIDTRVTIVDDVEVEGWTGSGPSIALATNRGRVEVDRLLVAVDAAARTTPDDPWPTRVYTVALETEAIDAERAAAAGWSDRMPFYTNELPLLWGRATSDGSLLAGRELVAIEQESDADLASDLTAAGDRLIARVRALHPAFASVRIRRIWAGPIARDASGIPGVRRNPSIPNVWWAGGYGGHGLAQAFRLGQIAADAVCTS